MIPPQNLSNVKIIDSNNYSMIQPVEQFTFRQLFCVVDKTTWFIIDFARIYILKTSMRWCTIDVCHHVLGLGLVLGLECIGLGLECIGLGLECLDSDLNVLDSDLNVWTRTWMYWTRTWMYWTRTWMFGLGLGLVLGLECIGLVSCGLDYDSGWLASWPEQRRLTSGYIRNSTFSYLNCYLHERKYFALTHALLN
jgi:hypothetical protein